MELTSHRGSCMNMYVPCTRDTEGAGMREVRYEG